MGRSCRIATLVGFALLPLMGAAAPDPSPPGEYRIYYSGTEKAKVEGVRDGKLLYRIGDRVTIKGISTGELKARELVASGTLRHFVKEDNWWKFWNRGHFEVIPLGPSPLPIEATPFVDFGPLIILRRYNAPDLKFTVKQGTRDWALEDIENGLSFVASRSGELDLAPEDFVVDRVFWKPGPVTPDDVRRCHRELERHCVGRDQCSVDFPPQCVLGARPPMRLELAITIERPGTETP